MCKQVTVCPVENSGTTTPTAQRNVQEELSLRGSFHLSVLLTLLEFSKFVFVYYLCLFM